MGFYENKLKALKKVLEENNLQIVTNGFGITIRDTENNLSYLLGNEINLDSLDKVDYQKVV